VLVKTEKLLPKDPTVKGESYTFNLPAHYVHILNCICEFTFADNIGCNCEDNSCNKIKVGANKLTTN